jgi:hypothetical protein
MLNPKDIKKGESQYEVFFTSRKVKMVQYDYRAENGQLFSCVRKSIKECMEAADRWMIENGIHPLQKR